MSFKGYYNNWSYKTSDNNGVVQLDAYFENKDIRESNQVTEMMNTSLLQSDYNLDGWNYGVVYIDAHFHYTNSFASGEFIFSFNSCIKYIIGACVHREAAAGVVCYNKDAYKSGQTDLVLT